MPYNENMKSLSFMLRLFRNPIEGIVFIFSAGLFSYAVYALSPLYEASYPTAISAGLSNTIGMVLAIFFALTTIPGLIAPFMRKERRERSLNIATFTIFVSFLFLFILRVSVFGWVPWSWMPLIVIALTSGYLHVWLKVRKD